MNDFYQGRDPVKATREKDLVYRVQFWIIVIFLGCL